MILFYRRGLFVLRALVAAFATAGVILLTASGCRVETGRSPSGKPDASVVTASDPGATAAIRDVLRDQVAAWNSGDVEGFMGGYARTDTLRFASGGEVHYGWSTTLARYRASYPNREAMGTLAFDSLRIDVLSPTWALAFGRWKLTRTGTFDDASGLFTLLFNRRPEGWRVLYDHTSSARSEP